MVPQRKRWLALMVAMERHGGSLSRRSREQLTYQQAAGSTREATQLQEEQPFGLWKAAGGLMQPSGLPQSSGPGRRRDCSSGSMPAGKRAVPPSQAWS